MMQLPIQSIESLTINSKSVIMTDNTTFGLWTLRKGQNFTIPEETDGIVWKLKTDPMEGFSPTQLIEAVGIPISCGKAYVQGDQRNIDRNTFVFIRGL